MTVKECGYTSTMKIRVKLPSNEPNPFFKI